MCGTASGYVASLPAPVRRRIKALKKLQLEATKIEAKFYEEVIPTDSLPLPSPRA